jgi:hypothetical protein
MLTRVLLTRKNANAGVGLAQIFEVRTQEVAWIERKCCLLVLNSVTSTPQWIRQPKPRGSVGLAEPRAPAASGRRSACQIFVVPARTSFLNRFIFLTGSVPFGGNRLNVAVSLSPFISDV